MAYSMLGFTNDEFGAVNDHWEEGELAKCDLFATFLFFIYFSFSSKNCVTRVGLVDTVIHFNIR